MDDRFAPDEPCLLIDGDGRRYLLKLVAGTSFQSHLGLLPHDQIIGSAPGSRLGTSTEAEVIALRPSLADFVLKMKRGPAVVYPKDLGAIVIHADVGPGSRVLEAGTGSGALTMALVRAVGASGSVTSVERRPDHAAKGRDLIERFFGEIPDNLDLRVGDVEDAVSEVRPNRVILDLPEPWAVIPAIADGMQSGGRMCAYVPTVPQLQTTMEALRSSERFVELNAFEVLHRSWNIDGRSVRPDHRMVGHTGFLCTAVLVASR